MRAQTTHTRHARAQRTTCKNIFYITLDDGAGRRPTRLAYDYDYTRIRPQQDRHHFTDMASLAATEAACAPKVRGMVPLAELSADEVATLGKPGFSVCLLRGLAHVGGGRVDSDHRSGTCGADLVKTRETLKLGKVGAAPDRSLLARQLRDIVESRGGFLGVGRQRRRRYQRRGEAASPSFCASPGDIHNPNGKQPAKASDDGAGGVVFVNTEAEVLWSNPLVCWVDQPSRSFASCWCVSANCEFRVLSIESDEYAVWGSCGGSLPC